MVEHTLELRRFNEHMEKLASIESKESRAHDHGQVLAVGEECAGYWGIADMWTCRCGAHDPSECKTETAK